MISPAALALLSVSIDGGPMNEVLAQLTDAVNGPKIDILYGHGDVAAYKSAGVKCQACTPEQIMARVVAGTPVVWEITDSGDDSPGIVILVCVPACRPSSPKPCRPELGAKAPLPPCSPLALGVTELRKRPVFQI